MLSLTELTRLIRPEQHRNFTAFYETGAAPDEFWAYVDADGAAGAAVELVLDGKQAVLQAMAKAAKTGKPFEEVLRQDSQAAAMRDRYNRAVARLPRVAAAAAAAPAAAAALAPA